MTYEDVRAYHTAFWLKGPVYLHKEWDKNVRKIVWGEKKVADHLRLTEATKTMFERYEDPWRDLSLTYSKTQSGFTQRCLLPPNPAYAFQQDPQPPPLIPYPVIPAPYPPLPTLSQLHRGRGPAAALPHSHVRLR